MRSPVPPTVAFPDVTYDEGALPTVHDFADALTNLPALRADIPVGISPYQFGSVDSVAAAEEIETPSQAESANATTMTGDPMVLYFFGTSQVAAFMRTNHQPALACAGTPELVVLLGTGPLRVTRAELVAASKVGPIFCLRH